MSENNELLFTIGRRNIQLNDLYSLVGPAPHRFMAVGYDSKTNHSKWASPGYKGLCVVEFSNDLLEDRFDSQNPYLYFQGGAIEFDFDYKPTSEQQDTLENWDERLKSAGIGRLVPERSVLTQMNDPMVDVLDHLGISE